MTEPDHDEAAPEEADRDDTDHGETATDGVAQERAATDEAARGDEAGSGTAPRGMLVERAAEQGVTPSPPPRRTGVFVDAGELRSYVSQLLRAMIGGYEVDALGNMTFTADGARIFVTVGAGPLGPQVGVFSITNIGVELVPDLAAFLLRTNHRMAFGAFSYDPERQGVWLRHSLLGGTLDGPELHGAILSIASTASQVADIIGDRFGGATFEEEPEDVRRDVHPPEPSGSEDPVNASGYL